MEGATSSVNRNVFSENGFRFNPKDGSFEMYLVNIDGRQHAQPWDMFKWLRHAIHGITKYDVAVALSCIQAMPSRQEQEAALSNLFGFSALEVLNREYALYISRVRMYIKLRSFVLQEERKGRCLTKLEIRRLESGIHKIFSDPETYGKFEKFYLERRTHGEGTNNASPTA